VAEAAVLEAGQVPLPNLVMLQDQVDTVISQLTVGVQQLQQITQENKSLREEIAEIKIACLSAETNLARTEDFEVLLPSKTKQAI
jgi:hypothetical protein